MIAVVQRSVAAQVTVGGRVVGRIGAGLLALAAVEAADTDADVEWMAGKLLALRIFRNGEKHFDWDVGQIGPGAGLLLISNFTVAAETAKGRRPSLSHRRLRSADAWCSTTCWRRCGGSAAAQVAVETGEFGAMMEVELVNDGPVTFIVESGTGATAQE